MPPKKERKKLKVLKVPLDYEPVDIYPNFPQMPILYLELLENKEKIKQELRNKDYIPKILLEMNQEKGKEKDIEDKKEDSSPNISFIDDEKNIDSKVEDKNTTGIDEKNKSIDIKVKEVSKDKEDIRKGEKKGDKLIDFTNYDDNSNTTDSFVKDMKNKDIEDREREKREREKREREKIEREKIENLKSERTNDIEKNKNEEEDIDDRKVSGMYSYLRRRKKYDKRSHESDERRERRRSDRKEERDERRDRRDERSDERRERRRSDRKEERDERRDRRDERYGERKRRDESYEKHNIKEERDERRDRRDESKESYEKSDRKEERVDDQKKSDNRRDESKESYEKSDRKEERVESISKKLEEILSSEKINRKEETREEVKEEVKEEIKHQQYNLPPSLSQIEKGIYTNNVSIPQNVLPNRIQNPIQLRDIRENDEESQKKRELLFRFDILRRSYKGAIIPEYTEYTDLIIMQKSYDDTVRRLSLDSAVESYKKYLIGGFMAVEFVLGKWFKFDMNGFTQQQMLTMNSYEKLLIELGEKSYLSQQQSNWPVEARLLFLIVVNAAVFVASKMIFNATGANFINMINTQTAPLNSEPPKQKKKMRGPDININDLK